jgi:glycosyltransferase involved in cell wall biosynthesis
MKISYITSYDALDIHNWSGLGYSIARMLEAQNADIDYIGNLKTQLSLILGSKKLLSKITGKKFLIERDLNVGRLYAEQIQSRLKSDSSIIFSPGSVSIALLETIKPKVFYTDATFAGMLGFYDAFSNICAETIRNANFLEQKALESSKLVLYSSDWAARTAIENYIVDPSKIKVVPFGANVMCNRDLGDIKEMIQCRSLTECNLLFIGVEWKRKGGNLAVKIAEELNILGLKTKLHIVGLNKIPIKNPPDFIINHGFISKSTKEGNDRLNKLFALSHFLLVPSIAEAYGLVFCEANSFGLPGISTNVGGISTIIRNDVNGKMFSLDSEVSEWCNYILENFTEHSKYMDLCLSSFNEYKNRLNWDVAGKMIMKFLKDL